MKKLLIIFGLLVGLDFAAVPAAAFAGDRVDNCPDINVVFARGSGGGYNETAELAAVREAADEVFAVHGQTTKTIDLVYPAVDVGSLPKLMRAYMSAGKSYEYG